MKIRSATPDDVALIHSFIQKKSEFDRHIGAFSGVLQVSEARIRRNLFGDLPFSYVLFAECSGRAIGFALYGFRYSSFVGRPSLWLDDLYVDAAMRSQGAGAALLAQLAQIARDNDCTHLAWNADARNTRGLAFYRRFGADVTEQHGHRCFLRWVPWPVAEHVDEANG
ncbi:GNAT family N-acetyltransferase [Synechococcus sp. FACHB-909]|uniref:GNAT family N-acetyltransferase n=1 Tax=Synechococcus sp. FACHB-909 TaxID=2692863 RepID=UPI001687A41B|nr:GNAT family N-acetyltransferase [Synechococcus sp. FACHB-909]MBD2719997.1 GNAT family N-acetyltransferase [Synechococcus sp. FACHB-909]